MWYDEHQFLRTIYRQSLNKLIGAENTTNINAINIENVKISLVLEVRRCYSENWRHVEKSDRRLKNDYNELGTETGTEVCLSEGASKN